MSLLDAMNAVCEDITADHCRGCVRQILSPGAWQWKTSDVMLLRNLWPDQQERQDVHQEYFFSWMLFCVFVVTYGMYSNWTSKISLYM